VNSTSDPFYPDRGYKIISNLSYAGLGSTTGLHYYKIDVSLMNYFSLAQEVVFASKLRTGIISATRNDQTPIEERFYLGGATSLRGWGHHKITPVNESGLSVGGNTAFEGSAELRFPVYDIFSGVIFMDGGNLWPGSFQYGTDLHYDAGLGIRIKTPIGPIRLDFASPVINDGFRFQFFISVGNAF
jgi:outer membrane protein assembly factor BamA